MWIRYIHGRFEKASEYVAGMMEGVSLQRPLVKTGGGDFYFKCEESNAKLLGT